MKRRIFVFIKCKLYPNNIHIEQNVSLILSWDIKKTKQDRYTFVSNFLFEKLKEINFWKNNDNCKISNFYLNANVIDLKNI